MDWNEYSFTIFNLGNKNRELTRKRKGRIFMSIRVKIKVRFTARVRLRDIEGHILNQYID